MTTKPDGGPAFPLPVVYDQHNGSITVEEVIGGNGKSGLSMRDYFAAAALTGVLGHQDAISKGCVQAVTENVGTGKPVVGFTEILARACFAYADAMIAERNKEG